MTKSHPVSRHIRRLFHDNRGAVLVEAAFALPILAVLISGIISYGMYFMAAHGLQSVANEGARASIAGLSATERDQLVAKTIEASILQASMVDPAQVSVQTSTSGSYFTVKLDFDAKNNAIFKNALVPMPGTHIVRSATVELPVY